MWTWKLVEVWFGQSLFETDMGKYVFQKWLLFAQATERCFEFLPITGLEYKKLWYWSGIDFDISISKRKTELSENILTHENQLFALTWALQTIEK